MNGHPSNAALSGQGLSTQEGIAGNITLEDLNIHTNKNTTGGRRSTYRDDFQEKDNVNTKEKTIADNSSYEITAQDRRDMRTETVNYDAQKLIGHGSFGAVFLAKVVETDEVVAIKKVLQDRRFKNRELQIMRHLIKFPHPYIISLRHYFISKGSKQDEIYLNLVLEFVPETIFSLSKHYNKLKVPFPILLIKIYMYQLSRALAHIHGMGICHRDIKPQNLLVDPVKNELKLCDFGSSKTLVTGEPNVAYICSRYYRAPELIFGSTDYTTAIDVWSQGCVLAELLLGQPIFPGSSGVDQLVEIIKILGTPTKDELRSMNPNYQEFRFPQIRPQPLTNLFKSTLPQEAIDLTTILLFYVPSKRCKAIEACAHSFFDEIRNPSGIFSDGTPISPQMFKFTTEELSLSKGLEQILIPPHISINSKQSSSHSNTLPFIDCTTQLCDSSSSINENNNEIHTIMGIVGVVANPEDAILPTEN